MKSVLFCGTRSEDEGEQTVETVGQQLRRVREEKGLSIKDIEGETSIRALYIKAIEEDDYATVPGEVYLKGFIRSYASHLGLNPQEAIELYRSATSLSTEAIVESKDTAVSFVQETTVSQKNEAKRENNANSSSGLWKWLALGVIVLFGLVGGFYWWQSTDTPAVSPKQSTVAVPTKNVEKPQNTVTTAAPVVAKNSIAIGAKFQGNCWTSVAVDGKTVYEGIPKSGESMSWEGRKDVVIKAGNAAAIEITKNGQPIGKLGNAGEVVEKIFSVNSSN